tara:strand:- start:986 stop:1111 length:126 start_codon:yes stop_codon:yes gene_type:complete
MRWKLITLKRERGVMVIENLTYMVVFGLSWLMLLTIVGVSL